MTFVSAGVAAVGLAFGGALAYLSRFREPNRSYLLEASKTSDSFPPLSYSVSVPSAIL